MRKGSLLFNAPQEGKSQQKYGYSGFAHGVEAERDQGQAEVGQANVQSSADAIWEHCIATTATIKASSTQSCSLA